MHGQEGHHFVRHVTSCEMMGENARSVEIPVVHSLRFLLVAGASRIIISPSCEMMGENAQSRLSFLSPHMRFDSLVVAATSIGRTSFLWYIKNGTSNMVEGYGRQFRRENPPES